jgi:syntaxin 5
MGDGSASRLDSKGKRPDRRGNGDMLALDLTSAEEGTASGNGSAFMQMQLVEQQVRCLVFHNLSIIFTLS